MVTINANKHKKPSRRHRRRPKNLLQEYIRRQKSKVWLETHIWHAKRFKMTEKWGYKIPYQPTDKSSRASYRATQHHCQMIDVSYMCCLEIKGKEENILRGVGHLCNSQNGLTLGAKKYLDGTREGNCILYKWDQYPTSAICPVSFMWRPKSELDPLRQIWIWCHPASYEELWEEMEVCFSQAENCAAQDISMGLTCGDDEMRKEKTVSDLADNFAFNNNTESHEKQNDMKDEAKQKSDDNNMIDISKKKQQKSDDNNMIDISKKKQQKSDDNNMIDISKKKQQKGGKETLAEKSAEEQVVINRKSQIGNILMTSLKDRLVRHRFIGPESQKILARTLHAADIISNSEGLSYWWKQYYQDKKHSLEFSQQREFWNGVHQCQSAAELCPQSLIGLTLRDPRVIRAPKHNDVTYTEYPEPTETDAPEAIKLQISHDVSNSPLWDEEIRKTVTSTKLSDFEINQLKSEHLVPGTELILGKEESRIPVLLIQNPGTNPTHLNHGHYGSGWDLILPAGWSMAFWVTNIYHGARAGGLRELQCLANEQQTEHFPEDYPDTSAGQAEENRIQSEKEAEHRRRPPAKRPNFTKLGIANPFSWAWNQLIYDKGESKDFHVLRNKKDLNTLRRIFNVAPKQSKKISESGIGEELHTSFQDIVHRHAKSLVFIKISMNSKGCPEEMGLISLPAMDDIIKLRADRFYVGPCKHQQRDPQLEEKKEKKKKAKLFKKGIYNLPQTKTSEKKEKEVVADDGDREIIGFVKHGGFSLNSGHGAGKGFCSLAGLEKLLKFLPDQKSLLLIRNPRTLQYRFAQLSI